MRKVSRQAPQGRNVPLTVIGTVQQGPESCDTSPEMIFLWVRSLSLPQGPPSKKTLNEVFQTPQSMKHCHLVVEVG